ncbi:hypothetical protein Patl1_32319 [Pistacia atlantica]|uniref:Uncharacterized protein n=1 Tax=Pistacia atlantica TaxID=434234 RepID=A0ACC1AMG3_9ROSI|nr:hypothetical protein Patl1_32319 [Pistacia atlantica]
MAQDWQEAPPHQDVTTTPQLSEISSQAIHPGGSKRPTWKRKARGINHINVEEGCFDSPTNPMICISWNCRGLGNPWTVRELHHWVKINFVVENRGASRGIAMLWKDDKEVELVSYTQHHISIIINQPTANQKFILTRFYGHPDASKRTELQIDLTGKWKIFREALLDCDLSEIPFNGDFFTWNNGREGWTPKVQRKIVHLEQKHFPKPKEYYDRQVISVEASKNTNRGDKKEELQQLKQEIDGLLEEDDIKWRERAKQQWLKEGDHSTKFFHLCANQRRKSNVIKQISSDDGKYANKPEKGSPGPDGFPSIFYQKHWKIIGPSVCAAVRDAFYSGSWPQDFNATLIALIPKIKTPSKIISPSQSAFIPDRLITDNAIVAFEVMHTMNTSLKGRDGYMALKLDMSKAYDRLECSFLQSCLR